MLVLLQQLFVRSLQLLLLHVVHLDAVVDLLDLQLFADQLLLVFDDLLLLFHQLHQLVDFVHVHVQADSVHLLLRLEYVRLEVLQYLIVVLLQAVQGLVLLLQSLL